MTKKIAKFFFYFFFILTTYYLIVGLCCLFSFNHIFQKFDTYRNIWDWDMLQHAIGDYDKDGKDDLISFTGCAFFSSVNPDEIPKEQRCTATGITTLVFKGEDKKIGQKYIKTERTDLGLNINNADRLIAHTYIGKSKNENWKIFVDANKTLKVYEIEKNKTLKNIDIPLNYKIDEFLYVISSNLLNYLFIPLIVMSAIFSPLINRFNLGFNQILIFETINAAVFTFISYLVIKKKKN